MRVIEVITRGDDMGGAQLHVVQVAERLLADGHDVLVITGPPGVVTDRLDALGVPRVSIPQLRREIHPIRDASALLALRREILRFRPDLVACHSSKAGILGRLAARLAGVPAVFTAHGWAFTEGIAPRTRAVYRLVERSVGRMTDAMICVSDFDRQLAIDAGIPAHLLITIHNGIPAEPAVPSSLESSERMSVVMTSRFVPQKDQGTLVRAVAALDRVDLHFVGDGPTVPAVRDLATSLGMAHRCHFHGLRANVLPYLEASDVFCQISHWEGFPLATLEAMRAGRPTIVSDGGGAAEAVLDGETGFVVGRGAVEELRCRLRELLDDPGRRRTMGQAARQYFDAQFTFDRMYERTVAVYERVIARKPLS